VRPQKQRYTRNNVAAGEFGDCHRTCIAMILNMHRDDVPHFMDGVDPATPIDDPAWQRCEDAEVAWLHERGLTVVNVPFPGETNPGDVVEMMSNLAHGAPVVLGCTSINGCNHSVVICDGKVHNPNDGHIAGPMRDGFWWLSIYSVGPNWRSPSWRDRLRSALRRLRGLTLPARVQS
jgi:hypothetical protein